MLEATIIFNDDRVVQKDHILNKEENIPNLFHEMLSSLIQDSSFMKEEKQLWNKVDVLSGQEKIWEFLLAEEICSQFNALVILEGNTWISCYIPKTVTEYQVGFYEKNCLSKAKRTYAFLIHGDRFVIRSPHNFDRSRYKVYLSLLQSLDWKQIQKENGYSLVYNKEGNDSYVR